MGGKRRVGLAALGPSCASVPNALSVDDTIRCPYPGVMDDQPSPLSRNVDDRSNSPKRKKVRQKYAPKACMSCLDVLELPVDVACDRSDHSAMVAHE